MNTSITLAGLALAAVTLAGCGGSGASSAPSEAAAPSSAASSAVASPEATPAGTPSAGTGSGTGAKVADPCTLLDADQIQELTGVKVEKGATQAVGGSTVCTWYQSNPTKSDAVVFSAQEGPLNGSLDLVADQIKDQFNGKTSTLSVDGADDARYVTGKKSGLNVIDVLAQKNEVFYQVLVGSPQDARQHKAAAIKITETLLQG